MRDQGHERLIGRTIAGKFVVEQFLGAGAMGAVFRARQIALEKTVAIKVLHGEHAVDPMFAARFHREAKAASRLNHPNSMQVIDFGAEPDGLLYIAMEYLDGRTLFQLLREQWPLPPARVADVLMQTLAALAVAHDMGVVHRDLKPENIVVILGTDDDGRPRDVVKVCDFGIAKIIDPRAYRGGERPSNPPVTGAGFLVGTPEYLSPEQGRGEKLDPRSDLYSVGVILFEMLTGRVPFDAENALGVVVKHLSEAPPRPSDLVAGVDPRLEAICLRALRKAPAERFRDAREMRAELRPVADGASVVGGPAPGAPGHPAVAAAATALEPPPFAARTVPMSPLARGGTRAADSAGAPDPEVKPTLPGTSATIPGASGHRALVIAAAGLAGLLGAGAVTAVVVTLMRQPAAGHADPGAGSGPATRAVVPTTPAEGALSPVPPLTGTLADPARTADVTAGAAHATGAAIPAMLPPVNAVRKPASSSPAEATATASPAGVPAGWPAHGPASTGAGAIPPGGAAIVSSPAPPASPAPAAAPARSAPALPGAGPVAAAEPSDPSFDPERGYVEIGLVNAQGAREGAVRVALRGVGLARCYRSALRARGMRAVGTATLDLSFDGAGLARSAIVSGADFLPGLTRCLQDTCASAVLPRSHLDPGGATAEVLLSFKVP